MALPVEMKSTAMPVACFAPELSDETIAKYEALMNALPPSMGQVQDAMRECLTAVKLWWGLPDSTGSNRDQSLELVHRGKGILVKITSLTPELQKQLFDAIPWPYELKSMQDLFDETFDNRSAHPKELVDACYHLLWYARELCCDREPLTQNKLN